MSTQIAKDVFGQPMPVGPNQISFGTTIYNVGGGQAIYASTGLSYLTPAQISAGSFNWNCTVYETFSGAPTPTTGVNYYYVYAISQTVIGYYIYQGAMLLGGGTTLQFGWDFNLSYTILSFFGAAYYDAKGLFQAVAGASTTTTATPTGGPVIPTAPPTPTIFAGTPSQLPAGAMT